MARTAPPITIDELKQTLIDISRRRLIATEDWAEEDFEGDDPMNAVSHAMQECLTKAQKDISKIDFDLENMYVGAERENTGWHDSLRGFLGFQKIDNLVFLGCLGGGDWQEAVAFVLYWDGKDIRGYVPTGGNSFVIATKSAADSHSDTEARPFDVAAMISDVAGRITIKN